MVKRSVRITEQCIEIRAEEAAGPLGQAVASSRSLSCAQGGCKQRSQILFHRYWNNFFLQLRQIQGNVVQMEKHRVEPIR